MYILAIAMFVALPLVIGALLGYAVTSALWASASKKQVQ